MPKSFFLMCRPDRGNRWYVSYYGHEEKRSWLSTGTTDRAVAEQWAVEHDPSKVPHIDKRGFSGFAAGWFSPDHEWVLRQAARGHVLSPNYLDTCRGILSKHVLPKWRLWKLEDITASAIDDWLFSLKETPLRTKKYRERPPLSSSRVNGCLTVLRIMLKAAARKGYIKSNPALECERMVGGGRERAILTPGEVRVLFDEANLSRLWGGNILLFTINLLGASTGCRCGEAQGLQVKHVRLDDAIPHIEIRQAWHQQHGLGTTKTKGSVRDVPLPALSVKYLRMVIEGKGPEDLVFPGDPEHRNHGTVRTQIPLDNKWINASLHSALRAAEIDDYHGRAGARWVTYHSHRHYYVSVMRGKLPEHILRALTGHTTALMVSHYTHTSLQDVAGAAKIQNAILSDKR